MISLISEINHPHLKIIHLRFLIKHNYDNLFCLLPGCLCSQGPGQETLVDVFPSMPQTPAEQPWKCPFGWWSWRLPSKQQQGEFGDLWAPPVPQLHWSFCGAPAPSVLGCTSPCPCKGPTQLGLVPEQLQVLVPAPQDINPGPFTLPRLLSRSTFLQLRVRDRMSPNERA